MNSLCVYCGSSTGADPRFVEAARDVGRFLAASGTTLVYGGGNIGLMGALADAALEGGGDVIGVIPRALKDKEVAHLGLTDLQVVESMHERKARMAELAEGFVALPGGLGTLEELFEVWTWGQLGLHPKSFGLLNVGGFFDPLIEFLDSLVHQQFVRAGHRDMLVVSDGIRDLLAKMEQQQRPDVRPKWIDAKET